MNADEFQKIRGNSFWFLSAFICVKSAAKAFCFSLPRRKLRNIPDPELFFQLRHLVHGHVEPVSAEGLAFEFLELLAMASYSCRLTSLCSAGKSTVSSRASCGRYMRMNDAMAVAIAVRSFGFCGSAMLFRKSPSHGMLRPQIHREFHQVVRLLKTGEDPGLFDLLVVILDEAGNQARGFPTISVSKLSFA